MEKLQTALIVIGRTIIGAFYLMNGINHLTHIKEMAGYAASKGVPFPMLAIGGTGVLLLAIGVLLLVGFKPKLAVAGIVIFLIPVTLMMHSFWNDQDPMMKQVDMIMFMKNFALLGSALMYLGIKEPWECSLGKKCAGKQK